MNMIRVLYKSLVCVTALLSVSLAVHAGVKVNQTIDLGGNRSVTWYLPDTTPSGWVFFQHGFQRSKNNLDDIASHYMDNGLMVLTANSNVTGGNASLARNVADAIIDNPPTPPNGYELPANLLLSGHSAGGLFVTNLGARLVERSSTILAGMVLFDPVDADNAMYANMQAVVNSGAPVLAILANSNGCNSNNNALNPLRNLSESFVGIRLTDNSKHFDVEGSSGGGWVTWFCGGGSRDHNIAYVQEFGLQWTQDILSGSQNPDYYPGGARVSELVAINDAVLIKEISGPEAPVANFGFSASELTVSFTDQSSDNDGSVIDYSWAFGDGLTSTQENPVHNYNSAGSYTVTLTVTDSDGLTDSVTKTVTVEDSPPQAEPPSADFNFSVSNRSVNFTNNSTDSDGVITGSSWSFGDGATSSQTSPTHTYAASGTYTVELTVTDNDGETDSITRQVTVALDDGTTVIESGVPVTNLAASWSRELDFVINVPDGANNVIFNIAGGSGDADIYIRYGAPATASQFDYRPYLFGNNETVNVASPAAGSWYIMIRAYRAFSGVTLTATVSGGDINLTPSNKGAGVEFNTYKQLKSYHGHCVTIVETGNDIAAVSLASCESGSNADQMWSFTESGLLKSKLNPDLCLTPGSDFVGNSLVFAALCQNVTWHQWHYKEGHLVSHHDTGKALQPAGGDEGEVVIASLQQSDEQQWEFAGSLDKLLLLLLGLSLWVRTRKQGRVSQ